MYASCSSVDKVRERAVSPDREESFGQRFLYVLLHAQYNAPRFQCATFLVRLEVPLLLAAGGTEGDSIISVR
jgi:hypothetical protein